MDLGLEGKAAIVTGATRGIGRHTAEVLAAEGCAVGICARDAGEVGSTLSSLEEKGVAAFGRALDVSDESALTSWVRDAAAELGGLDIVVANVSALGGGEGEAAWYRSFEVDVMHTVRTIETALPFLRESDAASIVIVSSVAARQAGPIDGPYGAVKAALVQYGKDRAVHLAPDGIRVNVVSPGTIYFDDGFWGRMKRENRQFYEGALGSNPLGRMGTPAEVARAIAFLASPASSFTTGTNLLVDGAITAGVQL